MMVVLVSTNAQLGFIMRIFVQSFCFVRDREELLIDECLDGRKEELQYDKQKMLRRMNCYQMYEIVGDIWFHILSINIKELRTAGYLGI
jgi:hypothetical protein